MAACKVQLKCTSTLEGKGKGKPEIENGSLQLTPLFLPTLEIRWAFETEY
jgi:hypothetical protein